MYSRETGLHNKQGELVQGALCYINTVLLWGRTTVVCIYGCD